MQLYYKLFWNAFFALFMGLCTCAVAATSVDAITKDWTAALLLPLFIALLGFITFLYCKMAWMRIRGVPVIELADDNLIVRDAIRKVVVIPYHSICDVTPCDRALRVVYQTDGKQKKKDLKFMLLDVDKDSLYDFLNEFSQKLKTKN
ncbi:MAG: hypothetical protein NC453_30085 [Muribaculum sp.]|nr:hypothetical protein [Muribaculum sp.]